MSLSNTLTALDGARDALVTAIQSRGGNLEGSATLHQCAAAINALPTGILSINGLTPDESGSVTIPDATQSASGLMSAADKTKLDGLNISENFGASGYFKLPGGTIVQYGQALTSKESNNVVVTLPLAYTQNVGTIVASCGTNNTPVAVARAGSLTTITLYTPSPVDGATINWMTMGY